MSKKVEISIIALLIIFAFYFIKKLFGDSSSFIKEYTDKHISLSKNEIEVFSKLNGRSGLTNIARSIISDHKNDRTLFVESFLYSETEKRWSALLRLITNQMVEI